MATNRKWSSSAAACWSPQQTYRSIKATQLTFFFFTFSCPFCLQLFSHFIYLFICPFFFPKGLLFCFPFFYLFAVVYFRTSPLKSVVCQTVVAIQSCFISKAGCIANKAEVAIKLTPYTKNRPLVPVIIRWIGGQSDRNIYVFLYSFFPIKKLHWDSQLLFAFFTHIIPIACRERLPMSVCNERRITF